LFSATAVHNSVSAASPMGDASALKQRQVLFFARVTSPVSCSISHLCSRWLAII
jgi:hypothetical protein